MKERCLFLAVLLSCSAMVAVQAGEDEGYFLPFRQKGQLIWRGRVEGDDGTWYDIRIVPGYTYPARYGWRNLKQAGGNLGEYFGKKKYSDMWDTTTDCFEWAYADCLTDFAVKGSGRAWKKYFGGARKRIRKRVFGWWMSYPWAFMQSTVDNVVRIPVGLLGTAAGTVWGGAVVPGYHLVNSGVKAVWNGGVEGVALPVAGAAWNTVSAPPLSLVGQRPSRERVDGFWVSVVDGPGPPVAPASDDLAAISTFAILLDKELAPFSEQRRVTEQNRDAAIADLNDKIRQLREDANREKERITKDGNAHVQTIWNDPVHALLVESLAGADWSKSRIWHHRDAIIGQMVEQGMARDVALKALQLLVRHSDSVFSGSHAPRKVKKTDPVRESIEVIKAMD